VLDRILSVEVLPRDIAMPPHVLGCDLVEYLAAAGGECPDEGDGWDPFAEAARLIDPGAWYTTSFDATPTYSVTQWIPREGSGLATVSVCSQAAGTTVVISYGRLRSSPRRRR
jgi:hypothetical protein